MHDGPVRELAQKMIEYAEDSDFVLALACAEKLVEILKKRKHAAVMN